MRECTALPTNSPATERELGHEISQLLEMDLYALRKLWSQRIGEVSQCLSADLLRRRLAYEMQSRACGSLNPRVRRRIHQLHEAFKVDPKYAPVIGQALMRGTVLVRAWRGRTYKVTVLSSCFEYQGRKFESLSEIARLITGTKWSGPAFFGFRRGER